MKNLCKALHFFNKQKLSRNLFRTLLTLAIPKVILLFCAKESTSSGVDYAVEDQNVNFSYTLG